MRVLNLTTQFYSIETIITKRRIPRSEQHQQRKLVAHWRTSRNTLCRLHPRNKPIAFPRVTSRRSGPSAKFASDSPALRASHTTYDELGSEKNQVFRLIGMESKNVFVRPRIMLLQFRVQYCIPAIVLRRVALP